MKRPVLIIATILILALLVWRITPAVLDSANEPSSPSTAATAAASVHGNASAATSATEPSPAEPPSDLAAALNASDTDIRADLRIVALVLETYRTNFLREGNPVGDNAEITAALAGNNRHRLVLIPRDHPAINSRGELCDRWGTPFFFHAESGTRMEIRSAGPDKKFRTEDDAVLAP